MLHKYKRKVRSKHNEQKFLLNKAIWPIVDAIEFILWKSSLWHIDDLKKTIIYTVKTVYSKVVLDSFC